VKFFLAAVLLLSATAVRSEPAPCVADIATRERVRALMLEGVDQGFRNHFIRIFDIWITEKAPAPKRAISGSRIAIVAYSRARAAAIKWTPEVCQ
jgi:hypothetical protein